MNDETIVIVAARRTALGAFQGALAPASAPQLSASATRACIDDTRIDPGEISEVLIGNVLPAGVGQAPARQAALMAGVPQAVPCVTLNKVCGSGMKTVMLGHDMIRAGSASVVLAGGMESMTNAPYLLPKARDGYRMGHGEILDHMFYDGLQNPYDGQMMGHFADLTAEKYGVSREEQDAFATASVQRALAAAAQGQFDSEIVPVEVRQRHKEWTVTVDEEPARCDLDKIPALRPAFAKDGTVTAASSSSISDGAASLLLMTRDDAERRGLEPLAAIAGHSSHAQEPEWFTTAPVGALRKLHEKLGWSPNDVDLYEINEAFAIVTMAAMQELDLDHAKVNVNGGACALGHPIGATGARLLVTLVHALRARRLKRGIASLCIGGGEGVAVALEIP